LMGRTATIGAAIGGAVGAVTLFKFAMDSMWCLFSKEVERLNSCGLESCFSLKSPNGICSSGIRWELILISDFQSLGFLLDMYPSHSLLLASHHLSLPSSHSPFSFVTFSNTNSTKTLTLTKQFKCSKNSLPIRIIHCP
jgi:hypothetical protein